MVALAGVPAVLVKLANAPAQLRVAGGLAPTGSAGPPPAGVALPAPPVPPPSEPGILDTPPPATAAEAAHAADDAAGAVPAAADVAFPVPVSVATGGAGARVKAVVVGNNDYPGNDHDLRAAVADADDMAAALGHWGVPQSNVVLLHDAGATTIVAALQWLVANTTPDDTAVVFYSGHGRDLGFGTQAIVAADGWLLTDRYLAGMLAPLPAHDAWIVMASCFGGGFDELLAPGRVLTAAADAHSLAYENSSFGRSYLGEYLVRQGLLQGEAGGPVVQQAAAWARAYLDRDAPARQITELDMSTGPISLDGVARATVPPAAALPPPPATPDPDGGAPETPPDATAPPGAPAAPPASTPAPPSAPPTPCRAALKLFCPHP